MVIVQVEASQVLRVPFEILPLPSTFMLYYVRELFCDCPCAVPRAGLGTVLVPRACHQKKFVHDFQSH